eukprot:GHVN01023303.1.p1 GENE.GHVN01023303.1~~GHVN01023303.1.p1  ORF type:complete len:213 (-),score=38.73 GHVN01023303.1:313-951(-)
MEANQMEEQKLNLLKARDTADEENKSVQRLLDFVTSATDSEVNADVTWSLLGDTEVKKHRAIKKQLNKVINEIKQGRMSFNVTEIEKLINQYRNDLKEAREKADELFIRDRAARLSEWYRDAHKKIEGSSDQDIKKACFEIENRVKKMEELNSPDMTSENRTKLNGLTRSIESDLIELDEKTREVTLAPCRCLTSNLSFSSPSHFTLPFALG